MSAKQDKRVALAVGRGCGKLYLIGEYAVMSPASEAIIVGVDRFVTVSAFAPAGSDGANTGRVYSRYYDSAGCIYHVDAAEEDCVSFSDGAARDIVGHCVRLAFQFLASQKYSLQALDLYIDSDLDDRKTGHKYGLGSSGAVAVSVVDAVVSAHGVKLSRLEIFKLAFVATTLADAKGSGGDIATASCGGVVAYRRPDMTALASLIEADPVAAVTQQWPGLMLKTRQDLAELRLLVGWTGTPVKTDEQLDRAGITAPSQAPLNCRAAGVVKQFPGRCRDLAEEFWQACNNADTTTALQTIRAAREQLVAYAAAKNLNIETPLLTQLADIAEQYGAAGKSSGSGGGDCGIALAPLGTEVDKLKSDWQTAGIICLDVSVASQL